MIFFASFCEKKKTSTLSVNLTYDIITVIQHLIEIFFKREVNKHINKCTHVNESSHWEKQPYQFTMNQWNKATLRFSGRQCVDKTCILVASQPNLLPDQCLFSLVDIKVLSFMYISPGSPIEIRNLLQRRLVAVIKKSRLSARSDTLLYVFSTCTFAIQSSALYP